MGRRDKSIAKKLIYDAYREFVRSGNSRATIGDVVSAAGMNRKTFYNHFSSKDELVAWGFRQDLSEMLTARHGADELDFVKDDPYGFTDQPCYLRVKSGTKSLDQSHYFRDLYDVFRENRVYYRALMRTELSDAFCRYLVAMHQELFCEDIEFFLEGRKMPKEAKLYVAALFAEGVTHHIVDSLAGNLAHRQDVESISPINNLVHRSMQHIVEAYESERSQTYFKRVY